MHITKYHHYSSYEQFFGDLER